MSGGPAAAVIAAAGPPDTAALRTTRTSFGRIRYPLVTQPSSASSGAGRMETSPKLIVPFQIARMAGQRPLVARVPVGRRLSGPAPFTRASGTPPGGAACLTRQGAVRSGTMAFALQGALRRSRALGRYRRVPLPASVRRLRAPPRLLRYGAFARRSQLHPCAPGLGQPDGNSLFSRARAVFSLADVVHLLANELSRLRGRRLPLLFIAFSSLQCLLFWHTNPFFALEIQCRTGHCGQVQSGKRPGL